MNKNFAKEITRLSRHVDQALRSVNSASSQVSTMTAQKQWEDAAYKRLVNEMQETVMQSHKYELNMLEKEVEWEQKDNHHLTKKRKQEKQLQSQINEQIAENKNRRADAKREKLLPGIDLNYHGYPDRPETPPDVRRQIELEKMAVFKAELDKQNQVNNELSKLAKTVELNNDIVNVKEDIIAGNVRKEEDKKRRDKEKEFYSQTLVQSQKAKKLMRYMEDLAVKGASHIDIQDVLEEEEENEEDDIQKFQANNTRKLAKEDTSPVEAEQTKVRQEPLDLGTKSFDKSELTRKHRKRKSSVQQSMLPSARSEPSLFMTQETAQARRKRLMELRDLANRKQYGQLGSLTHSYRAEEIPVEVKQRRRSRLRDAIRKEVDRLRNRSSTLAGKQNQSKGHLNKSEQQPKNSTRKEISRSVPKIPIKKSMERRPKEDVKILRDIDYLTKARNQIREPKRQQQLFGKEVSERSFSQHKPMKLPDLNRQEISPAKKFLEETNSIYPWETRQRSLQQNATKRATSVYSKTSVMNKNL